jgi:hypothetical protein
MAPFTEDTALIRSAFDCAWDLYQEIKRRKIPRVSMEILSMGMTGDFEIAVAAGANMVRIGRALFQ